MNFRDLIKSHQQEIVLVIGYIGVASLAFGLGQHSVKTPNNYNPNISPAQTAVVSTQPDTKTPCAGKIKGSSSMVYHIPGGSFYDRTTKPIRCFDTEAQAQAAGFKKSSR